MTQSVFPILSVNFEFKSAEMVPFPFMDYGFLYGYGLFETIRISKGHAILLKKHLHRLRQAATILDIPMEDSDAHYAAHIEDLIEKNNTRDAVLNIYLTPGNREKDPSQIVFGDSMVMMVLRDFPDIKVEYRHSLSFSQESFQRTPLDGFKTMSWMKNILERKLSLGYDDVLLYSADKEILEASMSNAFFVKGDLCYTSSSPVVLRGVTRQFLLDKASEIGIEIVECQIMKSDLNDMEEIFLTNAVRGIMLVDSVKGLPHLKSGKIAQLMQLRYRQLLGV